MGVLEHVIQSKRQGISENEIARNLMQRGFSPKEINDVLGQARIKDAVSAGEELERGFNEEGMEKSQMEKGDEEEYTPSGHTGGGMILDEGLAPPEPSYLAQQGNQRRHPMRRDLSEKEIPWPDREQEKENYQEQEQGYDQQNYNQEEYYPQQENYQEQEQGYSGGSESYPQQENYQEQEQGYDQQNYNQEEYYPQQYGYPDSGYGDYYQQGYGYPTNSQGFISESADTTIEIAEQVFMEKSKKIQNQLDQLSEFKTTTQTKVDNISDRLKRIEANIDSLQSEILEKVGTYGRGLEGVKKEMSMMQDSFGKVVNNLADKSEHKNSRKRQK